MLPCPITDTRTRTRRGPGQLTMRMSGFPRAYKGSRAIVTGLINTKIVSMTTVKKHRKAATHARKQRKAMVGPFRHADGDRRHRGSPRVEDVIAQKKARHEFEASMLENLREE